MTAKSDLVRVLADIDESSNVEKKFDEAILVARNNHMGSVPLRKLGVEMFGEKFPTDVAVEKPERVEFNVRNLVVFSKNDAIARTEGRDASNEGDATGTVQRSTSSGEDIDSNDHPPRPHSQSVSEDLATIILSLRSTITELQKEVTELRTIIIIIMIFSSNSRDLKEKC